MAGLTGEALRKASRFDAELEEAGWYEDARLALGASAQQLLQNVFGDEPLDAGVVRQAEAFHTVMRRTAAAQTRTLSINQPQKPMAYGKAETM